MNLLKSWRESFEFFKLSFFKESFGLLKGFLPFFLKYFSWVAILLIIISCVPNILYNSREAAAFLSLDWIIFLAKMLPYVIIILTTLVVFPFVAFVWSRNLSEKCKSKFLRSLVVFVIFVIFIFGLLYIASFVQELIYALRLKFFGDSSGGVKALDMLSSGASDTGFKANWLFGIFSDWVFWFKNIFLLQALGVFFMFELLSENRSIKNIFKPFLSYPFFVIFLTLSSAFIIIVEKLTNFALAAPFGLLPEKYSYLGVIATVALSTIISIFFDLFVVAVIANVYIKLVKKNGCPVRAWFSRLFGK